MNNIINKLQHNPPGTKLFNDFMELIQQNSTHSNIHKFNNILLTLKSNYNSRFMIYTEEQNNNQDLKNMHNNNAFDFFIQDFNQIEFNEEEYVILNKLSDIFENE